MENVDADEGADLLRENPNHQGSEWQAEEDGDSDEERDDVEALIAGLEQANLDDEKAETEGR